MARTWTNPDDALADIESRTEAHDVTLPVGHPLLAVGGRIVQVRWDDEDGTERMCFTQQANGSFSRSKTVMKL